MTRKLSIVVGLLALAFVVGGSAAYAQDVVSGNIPFKFIAAGRVHQPGMYELRVSDDEGLLMLLDESVKTPSNALLVEGRLASPATLTSEVGRLVFDKVGDTYYLSEAWFPGLDGFIVHTTPGEHTHETVTVTRSPKK